MSVFFFAFVCDGDYDQTFWKKNVEIDTDICKLTSKKLESKLMGYITIMENFDEIHNDISEFIRKTHELTHWGDS